MHENPFVLKGHIWIEKNHECFLGPGRIALLNNIYKEGSINAASKKTGLSYQHAWKAIEQLNRLAPIPVIARQRGGKDGGGAELTPYGMRIVQNLNLIDNQFNEFLFSANNNLKICF